MNQQISKRSVFLAAILSSAALMPGFARATIVEFQTNVGNFQVNLYDTGTPQTVANFLSYVTNFAYSNSIVHRSALNFVIQGGGFDNTFAAIPTNAPVINEPVFANVRGTIAMAKLGGDPNSATNQWFVNLANNTVNLDGQNGGFTVFGEVVSGMDVVDDEIAALPTFNLGAPFNEIPLQSDPGNAVIDDTFLVVVNAVNVIDETVDSAGEAGITPVPTTAGNTTPPPVVQPSGGGGGGSIGLLGLLSLAGLYRRRRILQAS